jgi:hypothetical protein
MRPPRSRKENDAARCGAGSGKLEYFLLTWTALSITASAILGATTLIMAISGAATYTEQHVLFSINQEKFK